MVRFELHVLLSVGAYGYDNWAQKTEHGGKDFTLNIPAYYRDNWKQPGDISKYEVFIEKPAVAMNGVTTTRPLAQHGLYPSENVDFRCDRS